MTLTNKGSSAASVDVVMPVYNERPEAYAKTLRACIQQTYPISRIIVVDDGSAEPISLPNWAESRPQISILRLSRNQGISIARNQAIASSNSSLLACINVEVVPDPDWLAICENYLSAHPRVGACYTRIVPEKPNRLLTRWRMRFHEGKFGEYSEESVFAPGHAVLFRREAVNSVGGYDPRYRRNYEDSDICERMRKIGWETHYVANGKCVSIQEDTFKALAAKQLLRDSSWCSPTEGSLIRLCSLLTRWTLIRAGRNLLKGRFSFLPIDIGVWACGLWMAAVQHSILWYRSRQIVKKASKDKDRCF